MNSEKSTTTPRLEINTTKITHNAIELKKLYGSKGIEIIAVTKGVCGDPVIVDALLKSGITMLADSRISNIRRMRNAGIEAQYMLLRTPLLSQIDDVISYTDISLNSELSVIKALSKTALKQKQIHKIVLMVEYQAAGKSAVKMGVGIDETRQNKLSFGVDNRIGGLFRHLFRGSDSGN